MLIHFLWVAHIAVLGYWLGSELVINSTYRHVSLARDMPFEARNRLMDHVMDVDQHVRYALLLQLILGFALLFLMGLLPGGKTGAWCTMVAGTAWFVLVEVTHHKRNSELGMRLAAIDRGVRYFVMLALSGFAISTLAGVWTLPAWLAWKLLGFVGVMACGVGIRLVLIRYFSVWAEIAREGSTEDRERQVRALYQRATSVLVLLWIFIAWVVWLSVFKPAL